ncbi:MAG: substrate-binding domain-containing protein [Planctomycetota bacterium]
MPRPAKYLHIADRLRERIATGSYGAGERLPGEVALAGDLSVNRTTVRKALSVLAEEGVIVRRPGQGAYVPPGAAAGAPGGLLFLADLEDHFFQSFNAHLCREARRTGRSVTALPPAEAPDWAGRVRRLTDGADAVIATGEAARRVAELVPPHALLIEVSGSLSVNDAPPRPDGDDDAPRRHRLSTDALRGAWLATRRLLELGHERVALLTFGWRREPADGPWVVGPSHMPLRGYRMAMREAGRDELPPLVLPKALPDDGPEALHAQAAALLAAADPRPTGIVCTGDYLAGPILQAAAGAGLRTPDDLSLIGLGNTPWAKWLSPALTSVDMGEADLARLCLALAADAAPGRGRTVRVDPHLVERQSTAPPQRL